MHSKTCPSCRTAYPADLETCPRDGSVLTGEGEWLPGAILRGKYAILGRTDADEISTSYRARALDSDELRTIRVLRTDFSADPSAIREFRRVGRVLQKIAHPGILHVEAVDDAEDGRPFLVTEFIETQSLAELMGAGEPLEAERVCTAARGVAAALQASHRLGLLHLDLQPRNILVTGPPGDEHIKIQGFGTAYVRAHRSQDGRPPRKASSQNLAPAALAYSSPEQVLVRTPEFLDARSDFYSLGVVMYQMLAGRLPFRSPAGGANGEDTGLASLAARLDEAPMALPTEQNGTGSSDPLAELVMQLLERRPELRPATAKAVIDRIELAQSRIAARAALAVEFKPPQPANDISAAHVMEGFPVAVVSPPSGEEQGAVATVPAPPQTASDLDAVVLDSAAPLAAGSGPGAASEAESPAIAAAVASSEASPDWASSHSILFRPTPATGAPKRTRWAWAAAAVLMVAGGVFFIYRKGLQWNGPGPLSPLNSNQVRTMMGDDKGPSDTSTTPAPQPVASQPAANPAPSTQNPPSESATSPAPVAPSEAAAPASKTGQTGRQPAPSATTPATSPSSSAPDASRNVNAGSKPEETVAEVNRAVAAGDVFFELGQYDLAVRAYQGPLKLDPNNKLLRSKIDRALKAKAAEQQFLGQ